MTKIAVKISRNVFLIHSNHLLVGFSIFNSKLADEMPPTSARAILVYNYAISLRDFVNYHKLFEREHDSQ